MPKELIALAGDLVTERKRISESLRRLEGSLMPDQAAREIYRALGAQAAEAVVSEVDLLARGLDRLGALIKTLVQVANHERLEACEPLLADAALTIEAKAASLDRPVVLDCRPNDVSVDREMLHRLRPVFLEMLETLVEFCVEPSKERFARKKRPKAYFQIEAKAVDGGCRIMVVCDGNGILPPMVSDHGQRLAEIGVRAAFEGRPGQWSSWRFHIPIGVGPSQGLPVRVGERRLVLPSWAVTAVRRFKGNPPEAARAFVLGEGLARQPAAGTPRKGGWLIEVSAGTESANYVVDDVYEPQEGFIKQLSEAFDGQGRFSGVVVIEAKEDEGGRAGLREELCLVLNPSYLVYGGADEKSQAAAERRGAETASGLLEAKGGGGAA